MKNFLSATAYQTCKKADVTKYIFFTFCLTLLLIGCSKDEQPPEPFLLLDKENITFASKSTETLSINISSNINWTVSTTQTDEWLSVTPVSGKDNGVIGFTATENTKTTNRTATVSISGKGVITKNITITQTEAEPTLSLSAETITFKATPSSPQVIEIKSNTKWEVKTEETYNWLTITPISGNENDIINFSATENIKTTNRVATVSISCEGSSKDITITQEGAEPLLSLSTETVVFKAIPLEQQSIGIETNVKWEAKIEETVDWLTITPVINDGNDSLILIAEANPGAERTASVIVSGKDISEQVIQITQSAPVEGENRPPTANFRFEDMIDRYVLINESTDPDGDELTISWESSDKNISFQKNTNTFFLLPYSISNSTVDIKLSVTDGTYTISKTKTLPIPETTWYRVYGMGTSIQKSAANNVEYDWFIDQNKTGTYSSINCGPTCATMVLKWLYPNFEKTTEDARNTYHQEGGWWYTNNIADYLNLHGAIGTVIPFGTNKSANLIAELDKGNIAILCLDMFYIRRPIKEIQWPVDKFYYAESVGWGHFIVIKGYKIVNNHILFEVYDPASSMTYSNGENMGKDRLYRSEDLMKSADIWWEYAMIVYPQSTLRKGGGTPFNMKNIPNQKGK